MLIVCLLSVGFIKLSEKYIMPIAADMCVIYAKEKINDVINDSVVDVIRQGGINTNDLFNIKNDNGITLLYADTSDINMICASASRYITENIRNMKNKNVEVPYGAISGIGIFANRGPKISFDIMPAGETAVDYETEFNSAGINQTNYKIWLTVNITVSLLNPIYDKKVNMTRKIMLVDTVIKGEVPSNYIVPEF